MRFQNSSNVQLPSGTPTFASPIQYAPNDTWTVRRVSVTEESGHSALIVGGSKRLIITLQQLLVTWTGVTSAGKIEIRSPGVDPLPIYQTAPAGQIVLPCYDEYRLLDRYGLRAANNSIGGEYSITAHYTVKENPQWDKSVQDQ